MNWYAVLGLLVASAAPSTAADGPPAPKPAEPRPMELTLTSDVTYATINGEKLGLDISAPKAGGPYPLVVCLHGGAWKAGSRKDLSRRIEWADFGTGPRSLIDAVAVGGYVAASVSYRLAPKAKFPAQIQDVKTALRFLRTNAKQFNIDPDRVAVLGFSAGGHLAALAGLTENVAEFAGDLYPEQSNRINAVVDFFGPADLTLYTETPGIEAAFMVPLLGAKSAEHAELFKKASPVEYVTKDAPPFLILHGTADVVVPLIHSKRLATKLTDAGVSVELVPMRNKGHGWFGADAAGSHALVLKFLDKVFKPAAK